MKKLLFIVVGIFIFAVICGMIFPNADAPEADIEEHGEPPAPEERLGVTEKELRAIVGVLNSGKSFWDRNRVRADDIAEVTRTGYGKKIDENGVLVDDPDFLAYEVVLKNGEEYSQMWIRKELVGQK